MNELTQGATQATKENEHIYAYTDTLLNLQIKHARFNLAHKQLATIH